MNFKWREAKFYVKKPEIIKAIKMDKDFAIEHQDGTYKSVEGDYLIIEAMGNEYVMPKKQFEDAYEEFFDMPEDVMPEDVHRFRDKVGKNKR